VTEEDLATFELLSAASLQEDVQLSATFRLQTSNGQAFAKSTDAGRERAGWLVARALGTTTVVPPTVLRSLAVDGYEPGTLFAVSPWIDITQMDPELELLRDDDLAEAAVFDYIIRHADRIAEHGNWLGKGSDEQLRLVLVDHADGFFVDRPAHAASGPGALDDLFSFVASVFVMHYAARELPQRLIDGAQRLVDQWRIVDTQLGSLLSERERAEVRERATTLAAHKRIPAE
jgi:hypothetical protein